MPATTATTTTTRKSTAKFQPIIPTVPVESQSAEALHVHAHRSHSFTTTASTLTYATYAARGNDGINNNTMNINNATAKHGTNPFTKAAAAVVATSDTNKKRSRSLPPALPFKEGQVPFDPQTSKTWVYPISDFYTKRQYQYDMAASAVLQNTLVCLPTGLGKTLVAAVVLYNYYRWFPSGKVLFLAPTLPLVDQQVQACYEIMGIPADDTALLTGKVPARERTVIWREKRVFFCTPQTVQKDLENARLDPQRVVCVVLDEVHKTTGDYAYCRVVSLLHEAGATFRLLGLSATPGTSIKAIQHVVDVLKINAIEAKSDADPDVKQYVHDRETEVVVVRQVAASKAVERVLDSIIGPLLDRLREANALPSRLTGNATITSYCLIQARKHFFERPDRDNSLQGFFAAGIRLVQIRSDLHRHGIGVARNKLLQLENERPRGHLSNIVRGQAFQQLLQEVQTASCDTDKDGNSVHDKMKNNPKLSKLKEILREHFERSRACGNSSRAIVFSQFRDSVSEIVDVLDDCKPTIRARHFVGQGKGAKDGENQTVRGMKQDEQKSVIGDFRNDVYNVLVCTCIGEEGLDIGEVDLIVNFDCLSSPIRMIQRVGRTGRKRNGRVVTLVSEGAEERTYVVFSAVLFACLEKYFPHF
jgi:fanconi anemia group M protein